MVELERLARTVRRLAGLDDLDLLSSLTIAQRVLGAPVRLVPSLETRACISMADGTYRIFIRALEREAHFDVAHELGHWALRELARYAGAEEERFANRIAGAIVAPGSAVKWATAQHGRGMRPIKPLANLTGISDTSANLRLSEVLGDDRWVATARRRNLLARVPSGRHPDRAALIAMAFDEGPRIPGIVKTRLTPAGIDAGRVALKAK